MHVTILDIWHGACLKKEKACMNDNSILLKISKPYIQKIPKNSQLRALSWEGMQQPPEPPRNFLPEVPLRSLSEHPGECWGCCESRVENPKRHGWNKRQHKREVTAAIIDHNFCDPTTNKADPQIRKSFQKPRGPVGKLLATTCGHPLAASRLNQLRPFKEFYVLRCSWNMSSTPNRSQSSTDFD